MDWLREEIVLSWKKAWSMILTTGVPSFLWAKAAKIAVYLLNHSPIQANLGITLEERFLSIKPDLQHLRVFGYMFSFMSMSISVTS